MTGVRATGNDGGVHFELDLDRATLLPGQAATGSVRIAFGGGIEFRGIVASLIADERWKWERTTTDAEGRTSTETVTERHELQRLPVMLEGAGSHAAGDQREYRLELPVPPMGPATFDGHVSRLTWRIEVKLDVPGFDPSIEVDVVVLQPTALLMAGALDLGQFALWPSADASEGDSRAAIALDPVPLCVGAEFGGLLSIATEVAQLQEVRLELRTHIKATVSSGLSEEITLWSSRIAGEGRFGGGEQATAFNGSLPALWLPTSRLPHGRADAQFHVILAKAWARDTHLVRDVAIASTREL